MIDLISRQALCEYALNQKDKSVTPNDIMRFPPAQPEIVHCPDCKYGIHSGCGDRYICTVNYELRMEHDSSFYCGYGKRRKDD